MNITLFNNALFVLADINSMLSEGVGLIDKIAYVLALISFIAGLTKMKHEPSEAGTLIVVALLFASAGAIVQFFFHKAGVPIDFVR